MTPFSKETGVGRWFALGLLVLATALAGGCSGDRQSFAAPGGGEPVLTRLTLAPQSVSKPVGAQQAYLATAGYSDGSTRNVTALSLWSSSAPAIASVDAQGVATALAEGQATVRARFGGREATASLTVTPPELVAIAVTPTPVSLQVGQTQSFSATALYSNGATDPLGSEAAWSSSQQTVASVDANGLAEALAPGATEIRASFGGRTGTAQLTVTLEPPPVLPYKAGAAEVPVPLAPFGSLCLGGYDTFCGRNATSERDPLLVGAMAFSGSDGADGEGHFVLVKTTNVGYFAAYKAGNGPNGIYDIRQRIARRVRELYPESTLRADQVVVTADHSHSGPDTIGIWGYIPPAYLAQLAQGSIDAGVAAYAARVPARLYAGRTEGPPTKSSYRDPPTNRPDREFRVLYANNAQGARVATLMNYAPHATVLPSDNIGATGDWTAWAAQEAAMGPGGVGLGLVGSLGAMDWNKSGSDPEREAEARQRLRTMLDAAVAAASELVGDQVRVQTTFIREPLTQPILAANLAPPVGVGTTSVRIERAELPPWNTGTAIGTYGVAARLGDIFLATFPGEPFPELHYALCRPGQSEHCAGGIADARLVFTLGAANDFLGYMLQTEEQYQQSFQEGTFYLIGCPEEQFQEGLGQDYDGACPDHWTLMVSPTIGRHLLCTLQAGAEAVGFASGEQESACPLLTAFDGQAAPAEFPDSDPVSASPAQALLDFNAATAALAEECGAQGAPAQLCEGALLVQQAVAAAVESAANPLPPPPLPLATSRAGVAQRDASWHLGASAGQFAATGVGIARDAGFDPYGHSVRKVGSDILGTRVLVRALVVEDGNGERVGVVTNELYLPNDLLHRRVVQLLREHDLNVQLGLVDGPITGLTEQNLATTSSHSHTSPFYSTPSWGTWIFQDVFDLRFYDYMARQMADAVIEASGSLRPVRMGGITVTSNDVQAHTYGPKTAYDGSPAGQPYDYTTQQASVLRFDDLSDPGNPKPFANWVIFGVHPEWVWGEEIVNGDFTHAVMRMMDRETGAMTLMSQRETGSSGPHKDQRVHAPEARHEFQESNAAGTDRAARLFVDTLKTALGRIERGESAGPGHFVPFASRFNVAHASQRFAPPYTRPYPGVSNCNTDPVFEQLYVGIPIIGFPDCFYDHNEALTPLTEPFMAALPVQPAQLRDQLIAAGVPVPTSYSATSLTAVEETAAVHLQVFKLGDVVAAFCPCEQFTSGAINLVTRLDRVADNVWKGFDWGCVAEARGLIPAEPAYAAHCERQNARYPETGVGIPGSLADGAKLARARAQIHNNADGWEALDYAAYAESEPAALDQIKGNFTHEEFPAQGYGLVLAVGMANDYWGYMPEYRDYRSFDHYRKALNGLGPHGADFLNTRLGRMAARLNGAQVELPFNPLDVPYQAESARAEALAQTLGELAVRYRTAYEATLPADGGTPAIVQQPEGVVPRFGAAVIRFVGGSNYTDMPRVRVERRLSAPGVTPEVWETYGTQEGEVQLQLKFLKSLEPVGIPDNPVGEALDFEGAATAPDPVELTMWRAGLFEWVWTASFEVFVSELPNLGARPRATPEGVYRFVVDGQHRSITGPAAYQLTSGAFTVVPWGGVKAEDLRVEADGRVSFVPGPVSSVRVFRDGPATDAGIYTVPEAEPPYVVGPIDYPDSYEDGLTWIDPTRILYRYGTADRSVHQQYCSRCAFRPWADTAQLSQATLTVQRVGGGEYRLPLRPQAGRWISEAAIRPGERASFAAGALVDQYGESNAEDSVEVQRAP